MLTFGTKEINEKLEELASVPLIKFGIFEKHTKFEKIFPMVLTNQLIYFVNIKTMRKIKKYKL